MGSSLHFGRLVPTMFRLYLRWRIQVSETTTKQNLSESYKVVLPMSWSITTKSTKYKHIYQKCLSYIRSMESAVSTLRSTRYSHPSEQQRTLASRAGNMTCGVCAGLSIINASNKSSTLSPLWNLQYSSSSCF